MKYLHVSEEENTFLSLYGTVFSPEDNDQTRKSFSFLSPHVTYLTDGNSHMRTCMPHALLSLRKMRGFLSSKY